MKIIQIIPTLNIAGAETMLCNLSCELANAGHEVIVLTFYSTNTALTDKMKKYGIRIEAINKKPGFDYTVVKYIRKFIDSERPDVIHTHLHVLPYVWLVCGKRKVIHTLHNVASHEQNGVGKIICGFIYKYSTKCIPVAISEQYKEAIKEYDISKKITVVENGIPIENVRSKEEYNFKNHIEVYHVGRFTDEKNHKLMIDVMEELVSNYPQIRIHFWGEGILKEELEKYVSKKNLEKNILFEGLSSELWSELKNGDIFILPSKYEGMPMSLIEAMAAGLPIIASNVGGIPDMIENGKNGILIEPNKSELARALEELMRNTELRERVGKNAQKRAEAFSSRKMMEGYLKVYANAVG